MLKSKGVTASVGDNMLTVRVEGDNPRLWRGALDKTAALAVVEVSLEGRGVQHRLVLTRAGHAPEEVASFPSREQAQDAFMTVSDAMMTGAAAGPDAAKAAAVKKRPLLVRLVLALGKLVLWFLFLMMLLLIAIWLWASNNPRAAGEARERARAGVEQPAAPSGPPSGVPLPAEQAFE